MGKLMRRIVRSATKGLRVKAIRTLEREREENERMADVSEFVPHSEFIAKTQEFWEGRN
jgi:hypothetical protein